VGTCDDIGNNGVLPKLKNNRIPRRRANNIIFIIIQGDYNVLGIFLSYYSMPRRIMKGVDGMYSVNGKSYPQLFGSRQQVGHETAYKTSGGLTKKQLIQTKDGRWKSLIKHKSAKKEKRLEKAGFFTHKGKFGYVRRKTRRSRLP